ncbi:MAG TPA: hypothetical protein VGG54_22935 [Trebonia sp.]|jgi:hypothetical protein
MTARQGAAVYVGASVFGAWCGVAPRSASVLLKRYDDWPAEDARFEPGRHGGFDRGWSPDREAEVRAWNASRPGQGARNAPDRPPALPRPAPVRYLTIGGVGALLGRDPSTSSGWLRRYHDWPAADAELRPGRGGVPDLGWLPERVYLAGGEPGDWALWDARRTGQGAPGVPKPRRSRR